MTDRQRLWQLREEALRSPALPVLWAIWDRGVELRLTDDGHVCARPAGLVTADELAVLRAYPNETKTIIAFGTADVVTPNFACGVM